MEYSSFWQRHGEERVVAHSAIFHILEKFRTEISVSTFCLMVLIAENSQIFLLFSYLFISDKFDLFSPFHFPPPDTEIHIKIIKTSFCWLTLIIVKKHNIGASLVAQWLRICLSMQGTQVRALVWEDPTCRGATRPVSHNYWACASGACAPQQERPWQWEARAPRWRVVPACRN